MAIPAARLCSPTTARPAARPARTPAASPSTSRPTVIQPACASGRPLAEAAPPTRPSSTSTPALALSLLAAAAAAFPATAAAAAAMAPEPPNALSLPTWAIHVSSVVEWCAAMGLFVKLAAARREPVMAGMAWGMVPLLAGAFTACTFHFFYNAPSLYPMVAAQAGLTVVGNATMAWAAWRIWCVADAERKEAGERQEAAAEKSVEG